MKYRIDTVADPDIETFNIAMPSKTRLSVFSSICPDSKENKRCKKSKQNKNQKR
jgi:hypothetical protein